MAAGGVTHFAVLVVIDAKDPEMAHRVLSRALSLDPVSFIGEPWPVTPITPNFERSGDYEPDFGTIEAFEQHPEMR